MDWFLDDGDVKLAHGDVLTVLRSLPAGIAQTCVTSPPYWGLRSYLPDGHDDKTAELGLEASPDQYVERLVGVFREVWRVLRDDGTVWLNLGDSFLPGKQLAGMPWRVAFALQKAGWCLRSDVIWAKCIPNPMPESVSDRPTKAHEYLFLLSKQPRYYWDADAIREPLGEHAQRLADIGYRHPNSHKTAPDRNDGQPGGINNNDRTYGEKLNAAGRNRRSVWTVPTEPFPEAHFATYPQALVRPCIQAGTSERGECSECGAPWVREVERELGHAGEHATRPKNRVYHDGQETSTLSYSGNGSKEWAERGPRRETTGWRASCTCNAETRPQTVIDPFIGSGTTALVARNHGRRAIGIDLHAEYLHIAAKRLQQLSLLGGIA